MKDVVGVLVGGFLGFILGMVLGSSVPRISADKIEKAQTLCEVNGGVKSIGRFSISCKNGAEF
jgi:hypothetical protein